jgi:hypothetical protein
VDRDRRSVLAIAAELRHGQATGRPAVTDDLVQREAQALGCTVEQLRREIDAAFLDAGDGGGPDISTPFPPENNADRDPRRVDTAEGTTTP